MALHYDLTKVNNFQELVDDDAQSQINSAIIHMTMGIGIRELTTKNLKEFFIRSRMTELTFGEFTWNKDGRYFLTPKDIEARIGLHTNADSMTKPQHNKHLITYLRSKAEQAWYAHGKLLLPPQSQDND